MTCHEKWRLRYHEKLYLIERPVAMREGIFLHKVLQDYYGGTTVSIDKLALEYNLPPEREARMRALASRYITYHDDAGAEFEVEAHISFKIDVIGESHEFIGYIDLLRTNGKYLVENKCVANPDDYDRLTVGAQLGVYFLGTEVEYAILNILRKPALKQKKTETVEDYYHRVLEDIKSRPKHYFHRRKYYRNEFDLKKFEEGLRHGGDMVVRLRQIADGGQALFKNTSACNNYGGCEYRAVCLTGEANPEFFTGGRLHHDSSAGD